MFRSNRNYREKWKKEKNAHSRHCLIFDNISMTWFDLKLVDSAGPSLWFNGDRGTATCNADSFGVLLDGVWIVQAMPVKRQS